MSEVLKTSGYTVFSSDIANRGYKGTEIIDFLKFSGINSRDIITNPHVSSARLQCAKNGEFEKYKKNGTTVAYGWYVWVKGFKGKPVIEWI